MNKRNKKKDLQKLCLHFCMTAYINSFVDVGGNNSNIPDLLVNEIKQIPLFSVLSMHTIVRLFRKGFRKTFYYAKKGIYWDGLLPVWKQNKLQNYLGETILKFISIRWENNVKHLAWKNFHSEILFSLLSHGYNQSVLDLIVPADFYRQFYIFIGLTEAERDIFCSGSENNDYTMNEKQTLLFIQNSSMGILFENYLDAKERDESEAEKIYKQVTVDNTKLIKIVRFLWKDKDYKNCTNQIDNAVFITAEQLANFFDNWCNSQNEDSLAKGMYRQYAKKLKNSLN